MDSADPRQPRPTFVNFVRDGIANLDECNAAIARLGELQLKRQEIQTALSDQYAKLKAAAEETAAPLQAEIAALGTRIRLFCEAHRRELLQGKEKSANLAAGKVSWRQMPPKVEVFLPLVEVIATLKKKGLGRFVAVSEDLNRQAILADASAVKRVKGLHVPSDVERGEKFAVEPANSKLSELVALPETRT